MASSPKLPKRLDEIYGGEPEAFTRARDVLAKELKQEGKGELAAEVKKLKRPTKAASVINRLSLNHAQAIARVLDAGEGLAKVQENLGQADAGEKLKAAAAEQRDAIDAALELAGEELGASGATLDRISETLHGTASDEATAEAVRAGRLEREGQTAGLGGALVAPRAPNRGRHAKTPRANKPDAAAARKLKAAESKLAQAQEKLEAAVAEDAEAAERVRDAERELRSATSVRAGTEKALDRARERVERAQTALDELPG
jgi:hypothetical protein